MITVAISQPTYLPWLGYLSLISEVDTFVFLDNVQFDKRSWQQRNQIKTAAGPRWLTVPVLSAGAFNQTIDQVRIAGGGDFPRTHLATLRNAYSKAPYFEQEHLELFALIERPRQLLVDLNMDLTIYLARLAGARCTFMRSSEIDASGSKADLLVEICKRLGATRYISALGSRAYLSQSTAFADNGIDLWYNTFAHPVYPQLYGEFVSHMSSVDVLFNVGRVGLSRLIMQGRHFVRPEELTDV